MGEVSGKLPICLTCMFAPVSGLWEIAQLRPGCLSLTQSRRPHGMAANVRFGSKADIARRSSDVRFGSKAEVARSSWDVRFSPESGHETDIVRCPLSAKPRHRGLALEMEKPAVAALMF